MKLTKKYNFEDDCFWVVAPCSLMKLYRRFRDAYYPYYQGHKSLWNVGKLLLDYTAQHLGRQSSSYSPRWEFEISQYIILSSFPFKSSSRFTNCYFCFGSASFPVEHVQKLTRQLNVSYPDCSRRYWLTCVRQGLKNYADENESPKDSPLLKQVHNSTSRSTHFMLIII
jgi:hypothetical protein